MSAVGRITSRLSESLLADDPAAIIDALTAAAREGASPADLGRSLAYAAALRVARFGTANEHSDWETAHHVFTYANAVHQALKRIDGAGGHAGEPVEAVRGLLHGAMALYLARYLNVPPASLPGERGEGSMICLFQPRRSALLCSTPSTANNRSMLRRALSPAILPWVTRPRR